ncbi:glycosyltransferase [Actinomycetospora cinnamomea]|uniref:Glycosyltransferase involved in cell wall biosynthesis n=1 Tax=Actinomycetospora cinnamomea TaxID=663609 RepID=A0A2U1FAB0_9PSEU|nr:glycosyltransferase [Actinomycetospora cinnamomea]PVZ09106.1 glycosyltransferase involved in cell wall biosynthesis [Actinomycetospora cinnamomea]
MGPPGGAGPLTVLVDAGPWLPVPPSGYGGIEAVLATLVPELRRLGVRVVLATVGASRLAVDERVTTFAEPRFADIAAPYNRVMGVAAAHVDRVLRELRGRDDVDLVHSHLEAWGLVAYADAGVPVLHTLHWDLAKHPELYGGLDGRGRVFVNGVSAAQLAGAPPALRRHALGHVHLATPLADDPPPAVARGDHLVVLARLTAAKGQDVAARLARRTGRRVVLAGPVGPHHDAAALEHALATDPRAREHPDVAWFLDEVAPLLDGDRVRWVGALHGAARDGLVASASAQLCPLQWEEPGGTGVVESLALGTPVVGYARGCLPELLDPGRTGLLGRPDDEDALAGLLAAGADRDLDRDACRDAARRRFTPAVMARGYLDLYREVLARAERPGRAPLVAVGPPPTAG